MDDSPILEFKDLNKVFIQKRQPLQVLTEVNLSIKKGEIFGLAGESGSGKSTLGKLALRLESPTSGSVHFHGQDLQQHSRQEMRVLRRHLQMIFQDPYSSLNPRMTIEEAVGEGIDIHCPTTKENRRHLIVELLLAMGLEAAMLTRYPHEFSGGQRQRISIARALAVDPQLIVCDEPLSALDACTQAQVVALLLKLKNERSLTYLFISHDMHAMRQISDRLAIMYLGRIVEYAPTARLFISPSHPYTQALLAAVPSPLGEKKPKLLLHGPPASPFHPPSGCPLHPRCPHAMPICKSVMPPMREIAPGHFAACHLHSSPPSH